MQSFFVVSLLLLAVLVACNSEQPTSTVTPMITPVDQFQWTQYSNTAGGFSFDVPEDWIEEHRNSRDVVFMSLDKMAFVNALVTGSRFDGLEEDLLGWYDFRASRNPYLIEFLRVDVITDTGGQDVGFLQYWRQGRETSCKTLYSEYLYGVDDQRTKLTTGVCVDVVDNDNVISTMGRIVNTFEVGE